MLRKIYFFGGIAFLYAMTIGAVLYSSHVFDRPARIAHAAVSTGIPPIVPTAASHKIRSGEPTRIVIPASGIDLPVDEGRYNAKEDTWTLSPDHAEFAVSTMPANDQAGTTFIYGHGTDAVFGRLASLPPPVGSTARVYTDSGHVFIYTFQSRRDLQPTDTSILRGVTKGTPRLIVQTCTGAFSEWRSEFIFSYQKVQ